MMKEILTSLSYNVSMIENLAKRVKSIADKGIYSVRFYPMAIGDEVLGTVFNNLPKVLMTSNDSKNMPNMEIGNDILNGVDDGFTRMTIYNGTPIWLNIKIIQSTNNSGFTKTKMYLKTFNTPNNIQNLNKFIKKCVIKDRKNRVFNWGNYVKYYRNDGSMYCYNNDKLRDIDSVFIPNKDKEFVKKSLSKFITNKDWYDKNNIAYHFGILLYGEPASGKSVFAQSIAKYIGANTHIISGDNVLKLTDMIDKGMLNISTPDPHSFNAIIIEDIDCGFMEKNKKHQNEDDERENGLATLLNFFDGINAPSNTIFIFTTNHIERLDPALIRPGRCDISIHVGYVNNETFNQFCQFHYGKPCPEDIDVKDGMTFAELQTELMKGKTVEELCEFVKKGDVLNG